MNIGFEIALAVLLIAVLFGGSHYFGEYLNRNGSNSLSSLIIHIAAGIQIITLSHTLFRLDSLKWPLVVFVIVVLSRKTILYYRAKTGSLENHEVA